MSAVDPATYRSIQISLNHLLSAIVKGDGVSRQSSVDLFKDGWIHLHPAIVKEDSVSCQSRVDISRHGWLHLQAVIAKGNTVSCQSSVEYRPIQKWLNSLTSLSWSSKGGQC